MTIQTDAVIRPSRRRWRLASVVIAVVASTVAAWCWFAFPRPMRQPPAIDLAGADPTVAKALKEAENRVRATGNAADWGRLALLLHAHGYDSPADDCFAQAAALDPKQPRWPYFQGLQRFEVDPDAAAAFLTQAARLADGDDLKNSALRLTLAEALLRLDRDDDADRELAIVRSRVPDDPRMHFVSGALAERHGDLDAAVQEFKSAAASPYARRRSAARLAALYQRRGDDQAAAEAVRTAAAAPEDLPWPDPYEQEASSLRLSAGTKLAQAERLSADGRTEDAVKAVLEAARDHPGAATFRAAGSALARLGRLGEAEKYLRESQHLEPNNGPTQYELAVVLFQQAQILKSRHTDSESVAARCREVLVLADLVLANRPDYTSALRLRGGALSLLGRGREAAAALEQAVRARPDEMENHLALAHCLAEDGQTLAAEKVLLQAVRSAPAGDQRARQALGRLRDRAAGTSR